MQEEVAQRAVALCAEASELSAGMLQQAMKAVRQEVLWNRKISSIMGQTP